MPHKDPVLRRERDRERIARRTAERQAAGLCPKCGKRPPEPGRRICAPCAVKARAAGRARDARLRAAGQPRRNRERARAYERERARRQAADRIARGVCTKCGANPAEPEYRLCSPCARKRRALDRARYQAGKAAGGQGQPDLGPIPESWAMIQVFNGKQPWPAVDVRVDFDVDPVPKLRRLVTQLKNMDKVLHTMSFDPSRTFDVYGVVFDMYNAQV